LIFCLSGQRIGIQVAQPPPPTRDNRQKPLPILADSAVGGIRLSVLWQKAGGLAYGIGRIWFVFGWRVGYAPGFHYCMRCSFWGQLYCATFHQPWRDVRRQPKRSARPARAAFRSWPGFSWPWPSTGFRCRRGCGSTHPGTAVTRLPVSVFPEIRHAVVEQVDLRDPRRVTHPSLLVSPCTSTRTRYLHR